MLDGGPAVAIPVFQLPGANALQLSDAVRAKMKELAKNFPEGVSYEIDYDPTVFVRSSIESVVHTLFEAVMLVVLGRGRVSADLARQRHSAGGGAGGHRRHARGACCWPALPSIR